MLVLKQNRVHMIASVIWTAEGWSMTAPALLALVISVCQNQKREEQRQMPSWLRFFGKPRVLIVWLEIARLLKKFPASHCSTKDTVRLVQFCRTRRAYSSSQRLTSCAAAMQFCVSTLQNEPTSQSKQVYASMHMTSTLADSVPQAHPPQIFAPPSNSANSQLKRNNSMVRTLYVYDAVCYLTQSLKGVCCDS